MEKKLKITEDYLYLPIKKGMPEQLVEFELDLPEKKKIAELMIPIDSEADTAYSYDYMARFPVKKFTDKTLTLKGEFPEVFGESILNASFRIKRPLECPSIHFTADSGWINDPNGLVYADGIYHLYFQYNPWNISWNNMSWGHAVSNDLLHWEQRDMVLLPDEYGMMFSGCGLVNERGLLGIPKDALLFFYSAAGDSNPWSKGKAFTQRIAYSVDGGENLDKLEPPYLDTICRENRDPKIFWHEDTKAYIMVLWLEMNDFAILRSTDLAQWEQTERFTLEEAWECPDLVKLTNESGEEKWMFWSADGFYYWGEFDGYHFQTDGVQHRAYLNKLAYAAQTYAGVRNRVISVPWLRVENDGRNFTGAMGIPMEFTYRRTEDSCVLVQRFVRELYEQRQEIPLWNCTNPDLVHDRNSMGDEISYRCRQARAVMLELTRQKSEERPFTIQWNETEITYEPQTGMLKVGEEKVSVGMEQTEFTFLSDDKILEMITDNGTRVGMFSLQSEKINLLLKRKEFEQIRLFEVQ